jgi:hypothetical protein
MNKYDEGYSNYMKITHLAYTDESSYTTSDRFGAIAVISLDASIKQEFINVILPLINQLPNEYKWTNFKNKLYFDISIQMFDELFNQAVKGDIRVDTIIWDSEDTRYYRNNTNYDSKLRVLYYLRLRDTLSKRWNVDTNWCILVDNQNQIDSVELEGYLKHYSGNTLEETIFGREHDMKELMQAPIKFHIGSIRQVDSKKEELVQIADIFAGMSAYSHNASNKLLEWLKTDGLQHPDSQGRFQYALGLPGIKKSQLSGRELWRFRFIKYVQEKCKTKKYQVSINAKQGLHTFDPKSPVNFFFTGE